MRGPICKRKRIAKQLFCFRESFDSRAFAAKWEHYRGLLSKVLENAIASSFGNHYPDIFWLHHSLFVARYVKGIPKRILHRDTNLGRERGDELKYRIYQKWIDRVVNLTYDIAHRLAAELQDDEDSLYPPCLSLMRDNVLILTEDFISPDLSDLQSYFQGCLGDRWPRPAHPLGQSARLACTRSIAAMKICAVSAQHLLTVDPGR